MSSRVITIQIMREVLEKKIPLKIAINNKLITYKGKEVGLIKETLYGTLRWYIKLEYILNQIIEKPIKKKDSLLKYLIIIGLYQLKYMRIPDHAVVSETVSVCEKIKMPWAKNLVNAVLRRYIRESSKFDTIPNKDKTIELAHPKWLIEAIKKDWPEDWEKIIVANNNHPPMYLRVNQRHYKREEYLKKLKNAGIPADITIHSADGILLKKPVGVEKLPGFDKGDISIQELSAQLAAELLDLQPNQNVLDACAAPGGKSAHILEKEPKLKNFVAIEKDKIRAKKIYSTFKRLKLNGTIIINDVKNTNDWWDGEKFDRILFDAPCSATGVIRRNPDIKILRTAKDVIEINKVQMKIIETLWSLLKNNGLLLYATCSILKIENANIIKEFMKKHPECKIKSITSKWGLETNYGKQILSGQDNMDGFFYACLSKS